MDLYPRSVCAKRGTDHGDGPIRRRHLKAEVELARDFDHVVGGPSGPGSHLGRPIRAGSVVDPHAGPELGESIELAVAARGDRHFRPGCHRQLQGEHRDASAALHDDEVPGPHYPVPIKGVPRRYPRAGQCGRLLERPPVRHRHHGALFQDDQLGQHPIDSSPQRGRAVAGMPGSVHPRLEEVGDDPIAGLPTGHARAERDHYSGPIAGRHDRRRHPPAGQAQVPVIERDRLDPHQHLTGTRLRVRPLHLAQRLDTLPGQLPRDHGRILRIGRGQARILVPSSSSRVASA